MWEKLVWRCLESLKIHVVYHRFSDQDCIFGVGVYHFFFGWTHGALHTFYFWLDLLLPRGNISSACGTGCTNLMPNHCKVSLAILGSSEKACIWLFIVFFSNAKTTWKDLGLGPFRDFKWSSTARAIQSNLAGRGWPTISHSPGGSWFQRPPGRTSLRPAVQCPAEKHRGCYSVALYRQDLQPVMRYEQLPQYFNVPSGNLT